MRNLTGAMRYWWRFSAILAMLLLLILVAQQATPYSKEVQVFFNQSVWQVQHDRGSGTAFFIERHLLITNAHVVRGIDTVRIQNANKSLAFGATVIKRDESLDLALLHCECGGMMPYTLPIAKKHAPQGREIQSAGFGLSFHQSWQTGIAQGLVTHPNAPPGRQHAGILTIMGDSGSAVVRKGEIVGVRAAIQSASIPTGGFRMSAIPQAHMAIIITPESIRKFLYTPTKDHHGGMMFTDTFFPVDKEADLEIEYKLAEETFVSATRYVADRLHLMDRKKQKEFMKLLSEAWAQLDRMHASMTLIQRHGKDRYSEYYRALDRFREALHLIREKGEAL